MFIELLKTLTADQMATLRNQGITDQVRSNWLRGRRLPTEVQVVDLAEAAGVEWVDLQKEVTVLRAPEERRAAIARAINWRKR